jgi:DNA-binding MarR family transcriptional regulator
MFHGENKVPEDSHRDEVDWDEITHELMEALHNSGTHRRRNIPNMEIRGELGVLHTLDHNKQDMTPGELATQCHVTTARMATTLNQLEEHGLILRKPSDTDRRRVMVHLTSAGTQELQDQLDRVNSYIASILKRLGEQDSYELIRIVKKLATIFVADENNSHKEDYFPHSQEDQESSHKEADR